MTILLFALSPAHRTATDVGSKYKPHKSGNDVSCYAGMAGLGDGWYQSGSLVA